MKIKWINHNGIKILALVVNDNDPHVFCENCGKKHYTHPKLAIKEDKDWCGDCNDEYYKKHMSDAEIAMWSIYEMERNRAVIIVRELDENE